MLQKSMIHASRKSAAYASPVVHDVPAIEFRNISKQYPGVNALSDFNLSVKRGEFITILGPSGCGKTTSLMMLSGFETPTSGNVFIDGALVNDVPAHRRDQGIMFQSYALFPHLTVEQNLAFPLEMRGIRGQDRGQKVGAFLARVHLEGMQARYPSQLSGGQQQRVALARALIADPKILLLDEPLGALDRNLRENMQIEIKALHEEFGITTVCVTHDQEEALTLSDRVVVMNKGVVSQDDTPEAIYDRPCNLFVASFLGDTNDVTQLIGSTPDARRPIAVVRPERMHLSPQNAANADKLTAEAIVEVATYAGSQRKYSVRCRDKLLLVREVSVPGMRTYRVGERVVVAWHPGDVRWVS